MGLPRSTYYDVPRVPADDTEIVSRIQVVCDEFETYGYRRVGAALRHQGIVVNGKKVRRLMREHDLQPRRRRRFVATTDSMHTLPVFPNLARGMASDGPNPLWVADITYVAVVRFRYRYGFRRPRGARFASSTPRRRTGRSGPTTAAASLGP